MLHLIKIQKILSVHHGRYRDIKARFERVFYGFHDAAERSMPPQCIMGGFKPVDTDLNLINLQGPEGFLPQEHAVREQSLPDRIIREYLIDRFEASVEKRLSTCDHHPQTLHVLKFTEDIPDLREGKLTVRTVANIAVSAMEIACVCDLELKIPKGGYRSLDQERPLYGHWFRCEQPFSNAVIDESAVLGNTPAIRGAAFHEAEGVVVEFIELVLCQMIHRCHFKQFQDGPPCKIIIHGTYYSTTPRFFVIINPWKGPPLS